MEYEITEQTREPRWVIELNPLLMRAFNHLTVDWQSYADMPKEEGLDWEAYNWLYLYGLADMRATSPYEVGFEGHRLYKGTTYEFRINPRLYDDEPNS